MYECVRVCVHVQAETQQTHRHGVLALVVHLVVELSQFLAGQHRRGLGGECKYCCYLCRGMIQTAVHFICLTISPGMYARARVCVYILYIRR